MVDMSAFKRCETIEALARDNHISCEVWDESCHHGNGMTVIAVEINWGDWKHDHLRIKYLVGEKMPDLKDIVSVITEEDGSDCYSAIHKFYF